MIEKNYSEYMFREALKTGFYDLQAARDEYRLSCGVGGMNCDMLLELLKKDGYVVKAGLPEANFPDLTLKKANTYLQHNIVSMRKILQKQVSGSKKGSLNVNIQNKPTVGLIYVNEHYDGWKKECLQILKSKFDIATRAFASDKEILSELQNSAIAKEDNFKQIQKLCMPFLRFKKDEVTTVGEQALDLKLPFGEIDVFARNSDLIKRQLGLERVEILSAVDPAAIERAGPHSSLLRQKPPSPGSPTPVFLTE